MCQRDQYIVSVYLLTSGAAVVSGGLFILLAMGKIHKTDQLKTTNEITKRNNESVLPTNISREEDPATGVSNYRRLKLV
jgi:hypothetical protein